MIFDNVIGQQHIKNYLIKTTNEGRIPHAQLFLGQEGSGALAMAIAYAQYVLEITTPNSQSATRTISTRTDSFTHPDLHYVYPVNTTDRVKSHANSDSFAVEWQEFIKNNCYGGYFDWLQHLEIEKKQAEIKVDEALEIAKKLALKSYQGGYKVLIIWMAEKMNVAASNKLLKLIEEPPSKTLIILVAESKDSILQTIISRCQLLEFPKLNESIISQAIENQYTISKESALKITKQSDGNYNKALQLLKNNENDLPFEQWFIEWVRLAFKAKGNASIVLQLIKWSATIAGLSRESQKQFINYCIHVFRQALLINYNTQELVYFESKDASFSLEKFAPFVNGNNINAIFEELELALYHIDRNGSSTMIFNDLSLKLTRLIHKK